MPNFLRLGGKSTVARVAAKAVVRCLSYCYGAFYTIVLFRQLVNAIQARTSFESVLGLLTVFYAMGIADTLLKGWYEHRFVPLAAQMTQEFASQGVVLSGEQAHWLATARASRCICQRIHLAAR